MAERTRGRPRSRESEQAILAATRDLVDEVGFEKLTIEGVAKRAGVGKQTVYRWWPSKGALVIDAVLTSLASEETLRVPDTGELRADLWVWLSAYATSLADPHTEELVRIVTAASAEHRSTSTSLNAGLAVPLMAAMVDRLRRSNHEMRPGADPHAVAAALVGAPYTRLLEGSAMSIAEARNLLDVLMDGVLDR